MTAGHKNLAHHNLEQNKQTNSHNVRHIEGSSASGKCVSVLTGEKTAQSEENKNINL